MTAQGRVPEEDPVSRGRNSFNARASAKYLASDEESDSSDKEVDASAPVYPETPAAPTLVKKVQPTLGFMPKKKPGRPRKKGKGRLPPPSPVADPVVSSFQRLTNRDWVTMRVMFFSKKVGINVSRYAASRRGIFSAVNLRGAKTTFWSSNFLIEAIS